MKRYAFIYNPAARGGNSASKVRQLEQQLESVPGAKLFRSSYKGEISEIIERLLHKYDVFVACGGDGTIREVASKLIYTQKKMGIIPLGTGNDLCKTLKIPVDLDKSLELLWGDRSIMMDVGQCNDFIFLNILGFGFDGQTTRYALDYDGIHPIFQYGFAALKAIAKHDRFKVEIAADGLQSREEVIMVSLANGRVEGGAFWIAPEASPTDRKMELVTVKPINKWLIPFLLPLFLFKKPGLIPHVHSKKVDKLTVRVGSDVDIHADGEIIISTENYFSIRLIPNSLEVVCGL